MADFYYKGDNNYFSPKLGINDSGDIFISASEEEFITLSPREAIEVYRELKKLSTQVIERLVEIANEEK